MTDARLPGRWLTDPNLEALSDRLWRVHTGALMWSAEQGTDGLIPRRTLRLLHPDVATTSDALTLVGEGLWAIEGDDFRVLDWEQSQSLDADVKRRRELDRERKRRQRTKVDVPRDGMPDVPRDVPRESSRQGESEDRSSSRVSISGSGHPADRDDDVSVIESRDASCAVGLDIDGIFDSVWAEWPKKTSRKPAHAKFEIAARRHPRGLDGLVDDAIAHGRAYRAHTPVDFVPMLSTWLHNERWDDPLPTQRRGDTVADRNAAIFARYLGPEGDAS